MVDEGKGRAKVREGYMRGEMKGEGRPYERAREWSGGTVLGGEGRGQVVGGRKSEGILTT